jgi:enolase-phosphatase E1
VIERRGVRAVVTDVEGTTTSLSFVKEQLFPYARHHLATYLRAHEAELTDLAAAIDAAAGGTQLTTAQRTALLLQWMNEDRKLTPLKTLQGLIWRSGYEAGELQGHVYEDAARVLRQWHAAGLRLCVYSSGSVEAQRLLFGHSSAGDLTPLFSGYFDTTIGAKVESDSYTRIAQALAVPAGSIVFLSDHPGEIAAAAAAGLQTVLLERARPIAEGAPPDAARSFEEIVLS